MKNKIISIILSSLLFTNSLYAIDVPLEQSQTTSASEWSDPASGLTYQNFGSVKFKFKKKTQNFTPWLKARAPSISAGCGGVSLDAGFAAFLDLETIGKQLEQASASVGMGVIVVLLQTMPSIGKAFENVQKLIRKLQSMLANSCQSTIAMLNNNPEVKKAKDKTNDWLSENLAADYFNTKMKGATDKISGWLDMVSCQSTDKICLVNAAAVALGIVDESKDGEKKSPERSIGISRGVANKLASSMTITDTETKVAWGDTIQNVFVNRKFEGKTVNITAEEGTYELLKIALFGTLAVPYKDGVDMTTGLENGKLSSDPAVLKELADNIETGKGIKPVYNLQYYPSINEKEEVAKFFTGEGLTGTATNSIDVPSGFNIRTVIIPEQTKVDSSTGSLLSMTYMEAESGFDASITFPLEFSGIYNSTYETILNVLNPDAYAAPATPIGVFMPKGNQYVSMIKSYSKEKDYPKYADLLAKINVKYAMQDLVRSAKADAIAAINTGKVDEAKAVIYLKSINEREKEINKLIEDFSGDVIYINNLDQIFINMKKSALEEKFNRLRGK